MADGFDRFLRAIQDLGKLEDDWDTYGALKPSDKVINYALKIGSSALYVPEVSPCPDGGVELYFKEDNIFVKVGHE